MAWKNFAGFSGTVKYTQWKSHNKKCSVSLLAREKERERERRGEREVKNNNFPPPRKIYDSLYFF